MLAQFRALAVTCVTCASLLGLGMSTAQAAPVKVKNHSSAAAGSVKKAVKAKKAAVAKEVAAKKTRASKAVTQKLASKSLPAKKRGGKQLAAQKMSKTSVARASGRKSVRAQSAATAVAAQANGPLRLESDAVYVQDLQTGMALLEKNASAARPIASISKLMTAMVVLDARQPMDEVLRVDDADVDRVKLSSSRLSVGTDLSRREMLRLALMSSENRAAHALARHYPGGLHGFVAAMNRKARSLGLASARFVEPTGLDPRNVSNPEDLADLVAASAKYPEIRQFSTDDNQTLATAKRPQTFRNTNPLVRNGLLDVIVQKTGYIREAGRCVVMQALINQRPTLIVLLDSHRKEARVQDALTIKRWLERRDLAQKPAGEPSNA